MVRFSNTCFKKFVVDSILEKINFLQFLQRLWIFDERRKPEGEPLLRSAGLRFADSSSFTGKNCNIIIRYFRTYSINRKFFAEFILRIRERNLAKISVVSLETELKIKNFPTTKTGRRALAQKQ